MATKGEKSRQRILHEAAEIFARQGFGATTVNDLLQATGTTKGNLYFHFAGKEAIGMAVLSKARDGFRLFLDSALQGPTPGAGLDHFFTRALDRNRERGFGGGCLFGNTALEASGTDLPYADLVREVFAEWIGKLQQTIAAAQACGEVRRDLPADQLAELVVGAIEGGIMQSRLKQEEGPLKRVFASLRVLLELKPYPGEYS